MSAFGFRFTSYRRDHGYYGRDRWQRRYRRWGRRG